jgi:opacity protein-like surface antigen
MVHDQSIDWERHMNTFFRGLFAVVTALALAPLAGAQAPARPAQPAGATGDLVQPPAPWHFYSGLGFGSAGGEYGEFLEKPVSFELGLAKSFRGGAWRIGGGLQFGSTSMKPPYQEQEEWAHLETFLSVTRVFNRQGRIRPYLQGRVAAARVHPRSELFYYEDPENLEPGASPTKKADGVGFTLQPGVQIALTKSLSLDVAGFWNTYNTSEYSLIPPLHGPIDPPLSAENTARNGTEWGLRTGLAWQPFAGSPLEPRKKAPATDPATGRLLPLPPADAQRDAWGVRRSWGWATGEMLGIDFVASMFNEYVRGANFNQISPRSFWHNIKEGFTWDDNQFSTNQFFHPWNGAAYFNAARANGIGFWGSSVMSAAGAFVWECCGETHPMSFNDMISTGIGGIARGEMMYRISSLILDNTKRGKGRWTREAAALLVNPIRGTNRLISGDAAEVKGNPEDPLEWRPEFQFAMRTGARVIGEGESISENTNTYGFLEFVLNYGNPWDVDRHKPYDRFDVASQVNFGDKTNIGRLLIRGDLFTKPLGDGKRHLLTLQQDFDYINNEAYEYGGQSLGTALLSRFTPSPKLTLYSRVQAYAIILGAVNSDYSQLADVAEQERIREYDYGPGVGGAVELYLQRKNLPLVTARYRYSYINVSNGSVYNGTYEGYNVGLESDHDIHQVNLKLEIPLGRSLTIGADGSVFLRRSRYNVTVDTPEFGPPRRQTITQRNPELRAFVAWNYNH